MSSGGLLRFGQAHLRVGMHADILPAVVATGGRTLFEKIVARHVLRTAVPGTTLAPGTGLAGQPAHRGGQRRHG